MAVDPELFSWMLALGSTLSAGGDDNEDRVLAVALTTAGLRLERDQEAEPEFYDDGDPHGGWTARMLAESLADELRTHPQDVVDRVCACLAEGHGSDLWAVLP